MSDTIEINARLFVKKDGSVRAVRNVDETKNTIYKPAGYTAQEGEQSVAVNIELPATFFEDRLKISLAVPETASENRDIKMQYDDKSGSWS
jgi:hypothetical protein